METVWRRSRTGCGDGVGPVVESDRLWSRTPVWRRSRTGCGIDRTPEPRYELSHGSALSLVGPRMPLFLPRASVEEGRVMGRGASPTTEAIINPSIWRSLLQKDTATCTSSAAKNITLLVRNHPWGNFGFLYRKLWSSKCGSKGDLLHGDGESVWGLHVALLVSTGTCRETNTRHKRPTMSGN